MENQTLKEILAREGFDPTHLVDGDEFKTELARKQALIIARSLSKTLDSVPYLTNLDVSDSVGIPKYCPQIYCQETRRLCGAPEVRVAQPEETLFLAHQIPIRLMRSVEKLQNSAGRVMGIDMGKEDIYAFFYKDKERMLEGVRNHYPELSEWGGYRDLRE